MPHHSYEFDDHTFDDDDAYESFGKRKDKRRPKGKRSVKALTNSSKNINPTGHGDAQNSEKRFDDVGLQNLYEQGYIEELLEEIKSGKEATVYKAKGPQGYVAAKLYRDSSVRSFKADYHYSEGRFISRGRRKRVLNTASKAEISPELAFWVQHEYDQLWQLHQAGIAVPRPIIEPRSGDMVLAGRVVLMEFIGDEEAAPRLSDCSLSAPQLADAFEQAVGLYQGMLELGRVHADFSAFNLLYWQERVIAIDFPQMIHVDENRQALQFIEQDLRSLLSSFASLGYQADEDRVLQACLDKVDLIALKRGRK